ncbi:hypothetical protein D3C85_728250 [compost metagenome]
MMGFVKFVGVKLLWALVYLVCGVAGIIGLIFLDEYINVKVWIVALLVAYIFLRCCWEDYENRPKNRK